jgi:1,4-alpha-glucan branching enzyme
MKRLLLLSIAVLCTFLSQAQLLTWTPPFPTENSSTQTLVITMDATKGNQGLINHTPTSDVFVHIGVITNLSTSQNDWRYSKFTWGQQQPASAATYIGSNKWTYTITGSLRTFFNITNGAETIQKIAILFRSGNGNKKQANSDGSDMFIPVYTASLAVRVDEPPTEPRYVRVPEPRAWAVGNTFNIRGNANRASNMKLYFNGTEVASANGVQTLSYTATIPSLGNQQVVAEAIDGAETRRDTLNIFVAPASSPVAALPAGVKDGINYETDQTAVTLVLHAPNKNLVSVVGDFNNWTETLGSIMNKTPDGSRYWIRLTGLTPGTEYAYQYEVDDTIRVPDPYAEKVLDQNNDPGISAATYPGLKPYPVGRTGGIVSVLQTAAPVYTWSGTSFTRPDKRGLIIYELLLRDFLAAHDWKTLRDTLTYLKRLGINAVEVMPFNEFEGNSSWGYNGYQYFAPDKYYGPKNTLKEFIDSCHKYGMAVIMDIVLNHTIGPSPLARLYWDNQNNRPAANNPWYNPVQPHAFGFGEDFNHESTHTRTFFNRVLQHWITEYRIDGYRVDFSKGLTQRASTNDGNFSAYDASRIAIINSYYNAVKAVDPTAYMILEHFADNQEEKELSDNGMMLWANVWTQFQEASMGHLPNSNFEGGIHTTRGWNNPHLVTFMESHDEERVTFKNIKYGNSSGSYNVRDTATALLRMELNAVFLLSIPGPKMIWEFGELGYDYSRCYLSTNGEGGDCDRKLDPKPIRWDYQQEARRRHVYEVYSRMNALRAHPLYKTAFMSNRVEQSLSGAFKWIKITTDTSNLLVVGNFGVTQTSGNVTFQNAGTWYEYLNNGTITATGGSQTITLAPGEFHVWVNRNVNNATVTPVTSIPWTGSVMEARLFPNPVQSNMEVKLNLPQGSQVKLELLNAQGQFIRTLHQGYLSAGSHQLRFQRKELSASTGSYYIRIKTRSATQSLKLTIQ